MPSVRMKVGWPDQSDSEHVSPSTIIKSYFNESDELPLDEFVAQAEKAFDHASRRVKERFGFHCSQAADALSAINRIAAEQPAGVVRIVELQVVQ